MALDTRDKRTAAILPFLPWRVGHPVPDATIGQEDRLQLLRLFRYTIASAVPTTVVFATVPGSQNAWIATVEGNQQSTVAGSHDAWIATVRGE